jgi:hypothetical protein
MMRATMSELPPATNGTIMRSGRCGKSAASEQRTTLRPVDAYRQDCGFGDAHHLQRLVEASAFAELETHHVGDASRHDFDDRRQVLYRASSTTTWCGTACVMAASPLRSWYMTGCSIARFGV